MVTAPPPPVVIQKKRGLGCFGCGCLAVILVLLVIGISTAVGYFGFHRVVAATSATPAALPTFDGGDDVYKGAVQKLDTFGRALQQNQPATLELSADEINTLIARNPNLATNGIHVFVTMSGIQANLQVSLPTNLLPLGLIKDRYLDGETDFNLDFNPTDKNLNVVLQRFSLSTMIVPKDDLPLIQNQLNPALNTQLQNSPVTKNLLDRAKTIEIRDGKLEIETQ